MKRSTAYSPNAPVRGKWRSIAGYAAAAATLVVTILAGALLWRPAGASASEARCTFVQAIVDSPIPGAVMALCATEQAQLTFTEANVLDLLGAALNRNDATVPAQFAREVRRNVPPFVETFAACRFRASAITTILRCRKGLSFYVTVVGRVTCSPEGTVRYELVDASVGAVRLPEFIRERILGRQAITIASRDNSEVIATSVTVDSGTLIIDLKATERGSRWLKDSLNL